MKNKIKSLIYECDLSDCEDESPNHQAHHHNVLKRSTTFHKKDLKVESRYISNNIEHLNKIHQRLT